MLCINYFQRYSTFIKNSFLRFIQNLSNKTAPKIDIAFDHELIHLFTKFQRFILLSFKDIHLPISFPKKKNEEKHKNLSKKRKHNFLFV